MLQSINFQIQPSVNQCALNLTYSFPRHHFQANQLYFKMLILYFQNAWSQRLSHRVSARVSPWMHSFFQSLLSFLFLMISFVSQIILVHITNVQLPDANRCSKFEFLFNFYKFENLVQVLRKHFYKNRTSLCNNITNFHILKVWTIIHQIFHHFF